MAIERRHPGRVGSWLAIAALACCGGRAWAEEEAPTFERDVRPILKAYCLDCHGGSETLKGDLDLRLRRFAERGGASGPALTPGDPDASLLLIRMQDGEMPPGEKKVPPEQVAIVERWIAAGASARPDEPESLPPGINITPEDRAYWAYQPLVRPEPPAFGPADRVRTPIDAFVLAGLRARGLGFAEEADRRTLIRRASLDLTGLPPTAEEVETFLADAADDAYERLVDRLLASPRYGERWARHWLDVAGYADSDGNGNEDTPRQFAYKYRDYVIRALNADKPLDRFIVEQLAGDELVPRPWTNLTAEQVELLAATGFLRMVPDATSTGSPDEPLASNQVVADAIKVVGSSLLGLTVGCAQCHDHRYDPIPQSDYFRLRAVLEPALDPNHWRRPAQRLVSLYTDADRERSAAIEAEAVALQQALDVKVKAAIAVAFDKELMKFPEELRGPLRAAFEADPGQRTEEQKKLLAANPSANITAGVLYQYDAAAAEAIKKEQEAVNAKRAEKKPEDFVAVLDEMPGVLPETRLFHRGDHRQPKDPVGPGDLTIAAPEGARVDVPADDPALPTSGRRLAYARLLTSGTHPLVGRVLANRIWLHHFGRGLVDTPGDFGRLGLKPTHPELLDWLAAELPAAGWSLKALHRTIMTSTVYRQTSRRRPEQDAVDTDNALYGRYPLRRLDAEALRDRVLAASGRLDPTMFGPPVAVQEDFVGQVVPADNSPRRSLYLQVRRTKPDSFLAAFDAPGMAPNCDRRQSSTSAPQALMLVNGDFLIGNAGALAKRLRTETPPGFAAGLTGPLAARYPRPARVWQYGFGAFDESSQRVAGFTPLPHWTGTSWQGGPNLPDPSTGWALLHAAGGHPGANPGHAAIRRWVAPRAGVVTLSGTLKHGSEHGDGIRGRVVSSRAGVLGTWQAKNGAVATDVAAAEVQAGDTIDLVVDCQAEVTSDSFEWPVKLALAESPGQPARTWDSAAEFAASAPGPEPASIPEMVAYAWPIAFQRPIAADELQWACDFVAGQVESGQAAGAEAELAALTNLCQQLLTSNEFLYVD